MDEKRIGQGTITPLPTVTGSLAEWAGSFLFDRKAQNLSAGTLAYYQVKLRKFLAFCEGQAIIEVEQLSAHELRRFLAWLEEGGHNPAGRLAFYRAIKTFLLWYESEAEPEGWKNPIRKVAPPKVPVEPLEPVGMDTIRAMLKACSNGFLGARDKGMLLVLLDTGARAAELLAMRKEDVDLVAGSILIRSGKGRKPRTVFFGSATRRALRAYLKNRIETPALWITEQCQPLSYWGLRHVVERRAREAGVKHPGLHGFRRAFALAMLRNGIDLVTLSRLMGHSGLAVLQRYLKQITEDLQLAHRRAGPVDGAGL